MLSGHWTRGTSQYILLKKKKNNKIKRFLIFTQTKESVIPEDGDTVMESTFQIKT